MIAPRDPVRWIQAFGLLLALQTGSAPAEPPPHAPQESAPVQEPAGGKPDEAPAAKAAAAAGPAEPEETDPSQPLYSLEASHQDAEALILEFARRATRSVTMLDRYSTRISLRFKDLTFEKGLRRLMLASDLTFRKTEGGYLVGLPTDLKLRFPDPGETVVDATYRCRRIDATSLVATITNIMGESGIKASVGPNFLTPEVEGGGNGAGDGDSSIKALKVSEVNYRTHDVVFSGQPDMVMRAMSLARKFDRPRKAVRVNVKIVEISKSFQRNLGVDWMDALDIVATEAIPLSNPEGAGGTSTFSNSTVANGLNVGKFNHDPVTLTATLNAMETSGNGRVLSNPTLLVLDGEKGFILSGTKYVFPQIKTSTASGQPIYETMETKLGVYLQVSVQVGLDDDMVMSIYPQVSSLKGLQAINGSNYPVISTQEEQATVRAVRGDVIVLGGLTSDTTTEDDAIVPFLGKLPIIGSLFSSKKKTRDSQELMFFLTPEIVDEVIPPLDATIQVGEPKPEP